MVNLFSGKEIALLIISIIIVWYSFGLMIIYNNNISLNCYWNYTVEFIIFIYIIFLIIWNMFVIKIILNYLDD